MDVDDQDEEKNWGQFLIRRASEAVTNIQNTIHSDGLETKMNTSYHNGHVNNGDSQDVKWMETVIVIAFLKLLPCSVFY